MNITSINIQDELTVEQLIQLLQLFNTNLLIKVSSDGGYGDSVIYGIELKRGALYINI